MSRCNVCSSDAKIVGVPLLEDEACGAKFLFEGTVANSHGIPLDDSSSNGSAIVWARKGANWWSFFYNLVQFVLTQFFYVSFPFFPLQQ